MTGFDFAHDPISGHHIFTKWLFFWKFLGFFSKMKRWIEWAGWLASWLVGYLAKLLTGWLSSRAGWLAGWLADWLAGSLCRCWCVIVFGLAGVTIVKFEGEIIFEHVLGGQKPQSESLANSAWHENREKCLRQNMSIFVLVGDLKLTPLVVFCMRSVAATITASSW